MRQVGGRGCHQRLGLSGSCFKSWEVSLLHSELGGMYPGCKGIFQLAEIPFSPVTALLSGTLPLGATASGLHGYVTPREASGLSPDMGRCHRHLLV